MKIATTRHHVGLSSAALPWATVRLVAEDSNADPSNADPSNAERSNAERSAAMDSTPVHCAMLAAIGLRRRAAGLVRRGLLAAGLVASMVLPAMLPSAHAALEAGAAAPGFAIDGAMGGEAFRFDLAQALKKGPVVVYFYPKAFTQGCTLEANAFAEAMDQYQALGATVIGVSGDDIATLKRFSVSECRGKFPVGADTDRSVMKAYQAVMPQREDFARRISYVITPDSKIAFAYESGSYEEHVPRTLAALKALDGGGRKR